MEDQYAAIRLPQCVLFSQILSLERSILSLAPTANLLKSSHQLLFAGESKGKTGFWFLIISRGRIPPRI